MLASEVDKCSEFLKKKYFQFPTGKAEEKDELYHQINVL